MGFRYFKRPIIVAHRWIALVLGLLLLFITTTGAVVVYAPELVRLENPAFFSATATPHPISSTDALAAVRAVDPGFTPEYFALSQGIYRFGEDGDVRVWGVDAGTGRITGHLNPDGGIVGWFENAHECFFGCDDYAGYVSWFTAEVPGAGTVLPAETTWATLALGLGGIMLLFLAITGIVIWWPKLRRIRESFTVRRGKGRYARDFDLHQLIGIISIPFLLMWALTGTNFELPVVSELWYSATGGSTPVYPTFESRKAAAGTPDISAAQAEKTALALYPGSTLVGYLGYPVKGDKTSSFDVWVSTPADTWINTPYPGDREVAVDRHDAARYAKLTPEPGSVSNRIWDEWSTTVGHYGVAISPWWRWIWVLFGLAPLALAVTGVSTWLYKRGVAKRKRERRRAREAEITAIETEREPVSR
jgi:uncharacterized iron-regulated membrane protein